MAWRHLGAAFVFAAAVGCSKGSPSGQASGAPIKIGVLLPMTGTTSASAAEPLNWARDATNAAGGIHGHPIELVYEDIGPANEDPATAPDRVLAQAQKFLTDPDIQAVIGTDRGDTLFKIAPAFVKAHKLLITPSARSANLTQAFGGSKFIWRTLDSDAAESLIMALYAQTTGAKSIAVLTAYDDAASSFYSWLPYHAAQIGLQVTDARRTGVGAVGRDAGATTADCANDLNQMKAKGEPDILFLAPSGMNQALCMVQNARAIFPHSRLFFSDGGQFPGLFDQLGSIAEGIEGSSIEPAQKPKAGLAFGDAYQSKFGHAPPLYAAQEFDAVTLLAYALQRANGRTGEPLGNALMEVTNATGASKGEVTAWDESGIGRALALIANGAPLPFITGATGNLRYDPSVGVDNTSTTYAVWQVTNGKRQWARVVAGNRTLEYPDNFLALDDPTNAQRTAANRALLSATSSANGGAGSYKPLDPRQSLWAFVAATSGTYANYRHQADALNMYQLLKTKGVNDDHIVLVVADDIASDPQNPEPGVVRNVQDGPNLHTPDMHIDYKLYGDAMDSKKMLSILAGEKSSALPAVLDSTENDDVFVFWVGHGAETGVLVGGDSAEAAESGNGSFITPHDLAQRVQQMFEAKKYRRLFVEIESCHGGVMGAELTTPGALLIAGAAPTEDSFAANYNFNTAAWDADAFAWAFSGLVSTRPTLKIAELYKTTFDLVHGSHVAMYNAVNSGQMSSTIEDYLRP